MLRPFMVRFRWRFGLRAGLRARTAATFDGGR